MESYIYKCSSGEPYLVSPFNSYSGQVSRLKT